MSRHEEGLSSTRRRSNFYWRTTTSYLALSLDSQAVVDVHQVIKGSYALYVSVGEGVKESSVIQMSLI